MRLPILFYTHHIVWAETEATFIVIVTHINRHRERHIHIHVLMRDEKEGRKKQARSNKQTNKQGKATQHTQGVHVNERYRRKDKVASKVKQTR